MRNQFVMIVVMMVWMGITSILCFVCWQAGGAYGPLFHARPSTDVTATLTPVSLSDDLTNTPLRAYTFSVTVVPKPEGLPASGYLLLVAIPKHDVFPAGSVPGGMLAFKGLVESGPESWKPVAISSQMLGAQRPFMIFLDCQTGRPDLVEFRNPRICREK